MKVSQKAELEHDAPYLVLVLLASLMSATGCSVFGGDDDPAADPLEEIQQHIDMFKQEARARGLDVDAAVDSVTVSVRDALVFDGKRYCGYVPLTASGRYSKRLLFSLQKECWSERSQWSREATVLHELGHALLNRGHTDARLPNGSWASIMKSKSGTFFTLYTDGTIERRDYYIDELFDPNTSPPAWGR